MSRLRRFGADCRFLDGARADLDRARAGDVRRERFRSQRGNAKIATAREYESQVVRGDLRGLDITAAGGFDGRHAFDAQPIAQGLASSKARSDRFDSQRSIGNACPY